MSDTTTENMRQYFDADGSPRRLDSGTAVAHCAGATGSAPSFELGKTYDHDRHGRVKLLRAYPTLGCFFAKPEGKAARLISADRLSLPNNKISNAPTSAERKA